MDFLSDSRRAAYENRIVDNNSSALLSNLAARNPRHSQKKIFYAIIFISIIVLIAIATLIGLLYNKISNLSQQIADLQAQATNLQGQTTSLQEQIIVLQNSATENFTRNLTELETSLANTQSEVQLLNQSLTTLGEDMTINVTQLENSLSNTQSGVQSLNQSLATLERSVNASIPTFLISYNNSNAQVSAVCQGGFVSVPGFEFSISSQNGGYGSCDFITDYNNVLATSSLGLDGSSITSIYPYQLMYDNKGVSLFSWSQNFEFSAGNHTITVMIAVANESGCQANKTTDYNFFSPRLTCTLYGIEDNN